MALTSGIMELPSERVIPERESPGTLAGVGIFSSPREALKGVLMPVSPRLRFEIFKRDEFTCRSCGHKSPEVVLEVDHIVPVAEGGTDNPINLATSCWECNRGKSAVPLADVMTGEDPHDRAVMLLERERQLREYNEVLALVNERIENDIDALIDYWRTGTGRSLYGKDLTGLEHSLERHPVEVVIRAMELAIRARKTAGLAYVHACLNNRSEDARPA